ncbi:HAD hydrolase, family IA, variant 3 [Clostridiales bacterium oral taxon 876 str. F0540]|nr:HAD hydrolase, family IA, variant 3 [Clostridiales bacterium oral taxon 876 str. F0540]
MEEAMKSIEGIIFDMDGTLFDTERVSFNIWREVAQKYGYSMDKEVYASLMGRKRNDANEMLLELYGEDFPLDKIRDEKEMDMLKFIQENGVPVKDGVYELLDFLVENGYKIALATSTSRERAVFLLERTNIIDKFSVIVCGDDVINSKPNPEIFLKAAEGMKISPKKCVVIEDSPAGIEAAFNGGMLSINVPDLKEPDEAMRKISNEICSDLLEVRDYLQNNKFN